MKNKLFKNLLLFVPLTLAMACSSEIHDNRSKNDQATDTVYALSEDLLNYLRSLNIDPDTLERDLLLGLEYHWSGRGTPPTCKASGSQASGPTDGFSLTGGPDSVNSESDQALSGSANVTVRMSDIDVKTFVDRAFTKVVKFANGIFDSTKTRWRPLVHLNKFLNQFSCGIKRELEKILAEEFGKFLREHDISFREANPEADFETLRSQVTDALTNYPTFDGLKLNAKFEAGVKQRVLGLSPRVKRWLLDANFAGGINFTGIKSRKWERSLKFQFASIIDNEINNIEKNSVRALEKATHSLAEEIGLPRKFIKPRYSIDLDKKRLQSEAIIGFAIPEVSYTVYFDIIDKRGGSTFFTPFLVGP